MEAERWRRIESLYYTALERDATERAAFLVEACAGDGELRREVESLLAVHEQAEGFMAAPALTGRAPFDGATPGEVMATIWNQEPSPLRRHTLNQTNKLWDRRYGHRDTEAQSRKRKEAFPTISFPLFLCGSVSLWHNKCPNVACSDLDAPADFTPPTWRDIPVCQYRLRHSHPIN